MPLTALPTKIDASIGRVKSNAGSIVGLDLDSNVPAAEYERLKTVLIDVCDEAGVHSGLSGSLNARLSAAESTGIISFKHNLSGTVAPAVGDDTEDDYGVGSIWVDTVADNVYVATDVSTGAANWEQINGGGGGAGDFLADGSVAMTGGIDAASGGAATPSYGFSAEANIGMYYDTAQTISFATNNSPAFLINYVSGITSYTWIRNYAGTVSLPGYAFDGDTDTGIYRVSADVMGISLGGTLRFTLTGNQILANATGTASAPVFAMSGAGIFQSSANRLSITTNNAERFRVLGGQFQALADGSAASPVWTRTSDTNTGLYFVGADELGLAAGGNIKLSIGVDDVTSSVNIIPDTDSTYSLGTTGERWLEIFVDTVTTADLVMNNPRNGAHWTLVEGHDGIYMYNGVTGGKFRISMVELTPEEEAARPLSAVELVA